jgi:hypothetical protein
MQPSQQQGRRLPSLSSLCTLWTWSFLVSCFLTFIVQQIHSFRAKGVRLSHIANALGSEIKVFFKSSGSLWTTPPEILLAMYYFTTEKLLITLSGYNRKFRLPQFQ